MSNDNQPVRITAPIEWYFPDSLITRYATNMTIQVSEHEYILSFYEIRPPLLFGPPENPDEPLPPVKAECVARIIVATNRMPDFLKAIQEQVEGQRNKNESEEGDEE